MCASGHRDADRIHPASDLPHIVHRRRTHGGGAFLSARPIDIDNPGKLDIRELRQDSSVMAAHMTVANNADPQPRLAVVHALVRPTMVIVASFADAKSESPSRMSVLPASIESAVAPAARIA